MTSLTDLFHGTLAVGPGQSCGSMENSPWTTQSSFPLPLCPLPDPGNSPMSSLFSDFGALSISQRRKVSTTTQVPDVVVNHGEEFELQMSIECLSS